MTYWQFWHRKTGTTVGNNTLLAPGDNSFFNVDQAGSSTKEVTNWETASKVPYPLSIQAISLLQDSVNVLADVNKLFDPGTYLEVFLGNTRVFEQLGAFAVSGTGLLVNFSLSTAAANQFTTVGEPSPNSLFIIPNGIQLHAGEAFFINLHVRTAINGFTAFAATSAVTVILHTNRSDITYSS